MTTRLQVLSLNERAQVHERTMHVLSTVGMRVDTAQGRQILREAGARVDDESRIVRFPPALVEESLRLAARDFSIGGRHPGWSFPMNAGESTLLLSGEATRVLDRHTGELRQSTFSDWLEATRLIDALDDVGVYWAMVEGGQTGSSQADWVTYNINLMRNYSKHIQDAFFDVSGVPWLLEVLQIVYGGQQQVRRLHPYSFLITPVSPLIIERTLTDVWLALRGWDIPVAVLPMPMMGATAPGSLLATTLLANCETLGMLCLVQAAEPGAPFIYAAIPETMDPRSGRYAGGALHSVLGAVTTEMARYYGLAAMGSGSGSDAFVPGTQVGYEKGISSLSGSLAWPDLLCGPGTLGGAMVFGLEQTVIDVEIFRICRKVHEGIVISEERWLTDVLERVGPGGQFIGETSTRTNARSGEWFLPELGVHDAYHAWTAAGQPDVVEEARAKVDDILTHHEPLPLGEDVERALEDLRARAQKV